MNNTTRPHNDRRWRRLRAAKLMRDPLCEYCLPKYVTRATQVDHVVAVSNGGEMWDWENLKSTCATCHSHKTMTVDVHGKAWTPARVKGVDARTGLPLDDAHWWKA